MRSFALIEGDRSTMMHVRSDGDVTVFDRDRESAIRFRIPMDVDGDTIWRLLSRVMAGIVRAEERLIRIDRLVERLQTGWRPVASEIDPDIPQQTLANWQFAPSFTRPETVVIGHDADGRVTRSDQILWIDADLRWALCESGIWWLL